jgi:hypothetical protein
LNQIGLQANLSPLMSDHQSLQGWNCIALISPAGPARARHPGQQPASRFETDLQRFDKISHRVLLTNRKQR